MSAPVTASPRDETPVPRSAPMADKDKIGKKSRAEKRIAELEKSLRVLQSELDLEPVYLAFTQLQ